MKISIIGEGNVGQALARGLTKSGHSVTTVGNDPARVKELAASGDVIFLAVPFGALDDVVANIGSAADGKPLVDVTNALTPQFSLAVGFTTSGAEELQKKLPGARVVKAFNTTFGPTLASGTIGGQPTTVLIAGDDTDAKSALSEVVTAAGLRAVDAGPLRRARELEALGYLQITLAVGEQIGWTGGLAVVS